MGNSIKFTHSGFVKIIAKNIDENLIEIKVKDTGSGITNEMIDTLF